MKIHNVSFATIKICTLDIYYLKRFGIESEVLSTAITHNYATEYRSFFEDSTSDRGRGV